VASAPRLPAGTEATIIGDTAPNRHGAHGDTGRVRQTFAHDALVVLPVDGDIRAPGAAITAALCGHWEHDPPCELAPHHTAAERSGDEVRLRVLFAAEPEAEAVVRRRIDAALSGALLDGPDGLATRWEFRGARPATVRHDERDHARRLARD
jgi:hypothetical protein